jgi:hypothetical protein
VLDVCMRWAASAMCKSPAFADCRHHVTSTSNARIWWTYILHSIRPIADQGASVDLLNAKPQPNSQAPSGSQPVAGPPPAVLHWGSGVHSPHSDSVMFLYGRRENLHWVSAFLQVTTQLPL